MKYEDEALLTQYEHMPCPCLALCKAFEEPVLVLDGSCVSATWSALQKERLVPQCWHLGGRYGGRIRAVEGLSPGTRGIPIPPRALPLPAFQEIAQSGVVMMMRAMPSPKVPRPEPHGDHTVHAEQKTQEVISVLSHLVTELLASVPPPTLPVSPSFTFCELFAGIGGFRVALEALGGQCVFASEINAECVETYMRHFPSGPLPVGDITDVPSSAIPEHDVLVGGFPCQPFSRAGLQPGFADEEKGHLYLEIVRILRDKKPRAFLLENVPGLLSCEGGATFEIVKSAFEVDGCYTVTYECVNARCLTAQNRNRLYFVGTRNRKDEERNRPFVFPYIPDLGICFGEIRESHESALPEEYTLTEDSFVRFLASRNWACRGPNGRLAWHTKKCETLISNYGQCVGNGDSMLVPQPWPLCPRRYTVRECARMMGFPDERYLLGPVGSLTKSQLENPGGMAYSAVNVWFKTHYRLLGNAVCPPVIAVLAGAILGKYVEGCCVALRLATGAMAPEFREMFLRRCTKIFVE